VSTVAEIGPQFIWTFLRVRKDEQDEVMVYILCSNKDDANDLMYAKRYKIVPTTLRKIDVFN
jgi:hypothetical protein